MAVEFHDVCYLNREDVAFRIAAGTAGLHAAVPHLFQILAVDAGDVHLWKVLLSLNIPMSSFNAYYIAPNSQSVECDSERGVEDIVSGCVRIQISEPLFAAVGIAPGHIE